MWRGKIQKAGKLGGDSSHLRLVTGQQIQGQIQVLIELNLTPLRVLIHRLFP